MISISVAVHPYMVSTDGHPDHGHPWQSLIQYHHSEAAGGGSEAGDEVDVVVVDGGCVPIVNNDMAVLAGEGGW